MASAVYWDTSALIKLYAPEPDSSDYLRLFIQQSEDVAISFLHGVELYFALCGKESRGEISIGAAKQLFQLFQQHVGAGRYYVIPCGEDVVSEAREILDRALSSSPPVILRSLDGLHFGAARVAKITKIVTADTRMRDAALVVSIGVVAP